jgi:arylsulfatase A-like enzyme
MRFLLLANDHEPLPAAGSRHRFVAALAVFGWAVLMTAHGARAAQDAGSRAVPNVMFLLADDLGFSDLGCYGGEIETPNLDQLAAEGLRFTQFYNTARCWPTRAVALTGYYAQQVRRDALPGVAPAGGQGVRPAWAPLLPAMLRPLGYRSYHSGKWHIDGRVLDGGFDRAYRLDDQDRFFSPQRHSEDDQPLPPVQPGSDWYATTAIADHAIRCLQEHSAEHADRPFFHYVCFTAPHFPLQAPQEDIDRYRDTYHAGWDAIQAQRGRRLKELGIAQHDPPAMEREVGPPYHFPKDRDRLGPGEVFQPIPWEELTDEQRAFQAEKMAIHAAMIDRMDREIGRLIEQLKRMGAFENTLILFASDNGASAEIMVRGDGHDPQAAPGSGPSYLCLGPGWSSASNTPLRRHKTWVHEGGPATPLVVHWPAGIAARGQLRHDPTHMIDIVPTVLELAGSKHPETWNGQPVPPPPGRSLVPAFAADGAVHHPYLWWLHNGHRAIRMGDWKLVADREGPWELYHLAIDRGESNDLAASDPERVAELAAFWQARADEFRELALADLQPGEAPKKPAAKPAKTAAGKRKSGESGFVTLFDGQNLDAWIVSPTAQWEIRDGVIALERTDGGLNNDDYLWTKERYSDFVLELEFQASEGYCNSGVFFRTADLADPVNTGIEMQVTNSYGRPLSRGGTAGAIYDFLAPTKNTVRPPGQWNQARITCRGSQIQVELNGEKILEMDVDQWTEAGTNPDGTSNSFDRPLKDFPREGHIGLQDHGRPVWYRNIRVKRLDGEASK